MFSGGGGDDDDDTETFSRIASSLLPPPPPPPLLAAAADTTPPPPATAQSQPQWSQDETRELIRVRGDLEHDFTATKRNKTLWEVVSKRMRERGYRRTPDQCKCKWKNLLNRYKDKETSDPDDGRHCPFFDELHALFNERAKNLQKTQLESEGTSVRGKKKLKSIGEDQSSDEHSGEEDDEDYVAFDEERPSSSRKRKAESFGFEKPSRAAGVACASKSTRNNVFQLLKDFLQQQQMMDMQWKELMERRARERVSFELEWRQSMEKLERERLMSEQAWREREEQRRLREDSRAERRDALLTTLLNKMLQERNL